VISPRGRTLPFVEISLLLQRSDRGGRTLLAIPDLAPACVRRVLGLSGLSQ